MVAILLDIFGRIDNKTMLATECEKLHAQLVKEQVGGEQK
jgi:hypothetical protein